MVASPLSTPTPPIPTTQAENYVSTSSSQRTDVNQSFCPPFPNDEAIDAYVSVCYLEHPISCSIYLQLR